MLHQPLLLDRPFPVQVFLAVVVPVAFGILTGYLLGTSEVGYLICSLLGVLGGLAAGYDHLGADQGFLRGIMGGAQFSTAILAAHSLFGDTAKADVPSPVVLIVAFTILGALLGAWGGALRARGEKRRAAVAA